jgi:hypothetical protein
MAGSNHPNHTVLARELQRYLRWRNARHWPYASQAMCTAADALPSPVQPSAPWLCNPAVGEVSVEYRRLTAGIGGVDARRLSFHEHQSAVPTSFVCGP